jgi:hypothetical protein
MAHGGALPPISISLFLLRIREGKQLQLWDSNVHWIPKFRSFRSPVPTYRSFQDIDYKWFSH